MLGSALQPWSLPPRDPVPLEHVLKDHLKSLLATYCQYSESLIELWSYRRRFVFFLKKKKKENLNTAFKRRIQDKLRPQEVSLMKG